MRIKCTTSRSLLDKVKMKRFSKSFFFKTEFPCCFGVMKYEYIQIGVWPPAMISRNQFCVHARQFTACCRFCHRDKYETRVNVVRVWSFSYWFASHMFQWSQHMCVGVAWCRIEWIVRACWIENSYREQERTSLHTCTARTLLCHFTISLLLISFEQKGPTAPAGAAVHLPGGSEEFERIIKRAAQRVND